MALTEAGAPDWAQIEADYRAGVKVLRQIAGEHGLTEGAIRKRAKKEAWERDLAAKIREKAGALVRKDAVRNQVRKEQAVTETEIVSANAEVLANAMRRHQVGLVKAWDVVDMLMSELQHQTVNQDMYEQLGEVLYSPDKNGVDKLNEIYRKALSLPSRAGTAKQLLDAIKVAITLEREVLNITSSAGEEGGANGGNGNTTNIFIGLQATSGFFGRVTTEGSGRTLSQPMPDRPLLPAAVRTQPA